MTSRATDIDRHVGARIRARRVELGMSQSDLATKIGITYQQEFKYEKGLNRISAGRLFEVSQALGVSIAYFYEGIGEPHEDLGSRDTLELSRLYSALPEKQREAIRNLARSMAA